MKKRPKMIPDAICEEMLSVFNEILTGEQELAPDIRACLTGAVESKEKMEQLGEQYMLVRTSCETPYVALLEAAERTLKLWGLS